MDDAFEAPDRSGSLTDPMGFDYRKNRPWMENLHIVMQIGLTMAGCIVFCFFLGRYLDRWLGTRGVFVTIFTILGVIGGANTTYRQIMKTIKDEKSDEHPPSDGNGQGNA